MKIEREVSDLHLGDLWSIHLSRGSYQYLFIRQSNRREREVQEHHSENKQQVQQT